MHGVRAFGCGTKRLRTWNRRQVKTWNRRRDESGVRRNTGLLARRLVPKLEPSESAYKPAHSAQYRLCVCLCVRALGPPVARIRVMYRWDKQTDESVHMAANDAGSLAGASIGADAGTEASAGTSAGPLPALRESCFQRWREFVLRRIRGGHTKLLPHQCDALTAIEAFFDPDGQGQSRHTLAPMIPCVICMPTGTGKSAVAALAPYVLNACRVLLICPTLATTMQLAGHMSDQQPLSQKLLVKLDIVPLEGARSRGCLPFTRACRQFCAGALTDDTAIYELVVVSAHAFATRTGKPPWHSLRADLFDVVIVEDAHAFPASFWKEAGRHFTGKVIFLTATPPAQLGEPAYHFTGTRVANCGETSMRGDGAPEDTHADAPFLASVV